MIDEISLLRERVEVRGFLSIDNACIDVGNITAVIGPQASGKSIIAKLIYFGRTYLGSYFSGIYEPDFDLRNFKYGKVEEFSRLFGGLVGFDGDFEISYTYADFIVGVQRKKSGRVFISHSATLDKQGRQVKKEYERFQISLSKDSNSRSRIPTSFYFQREWEGAKAFYRSVPDALFVPASRSFYSTISDELFTFFANEERIDPLIAQFGSFYEFAKRKASGDWFGVHRPSVATAKFNDKLRPVIDGEFIREKSKDFIKTGWGKVPLRSSSSGQQEALPLLFSILEYPGSQQGPHMIIIEEPEAHLFPSAQKYILDLMVEAVVESGCDMFFTTHSPYVLSCLNNHIVRRSSKKIKLGRDIEFCAYFSERGGVRNIVDLETGLIETNGLDEVSGVIASEFMEAILE